MDEREFEKAFGDLGTDKEAGYVLINDGGPLYGIYNYKDGMRTIIEDNEKAAKVIAKMVEHNVPIYHSVKELPEPTNKPRPWTIEEMEAEIKRKKGLK